MKNCLLSTLLIPVLLLVPFASALAAPGGESLLTRLPNGLTVYVIRDTRFPLAVTRLFVRTGSANEDAAQAGISHLLEHMVFKGTDHRPKGQVARDVEALGGYLNAATSFDKTWYMTDMPAAHWRMGMDVVKEMAFQPALDPRELEAEKEVVVSELERDQDSPTRRLFELLQVDTLRNTPYGRPIIGYRETVRAITADDLRAYVRRWYQPQNMLLLVAGDVNPQEVLEHARALFGGLANTNDLPAPAAVAPDTPPAGPRVEVVRGPWSKVYLGMAFPAPALADMRSVALDAAAWLLGGDPTSLLCRKYAYERQLVDDISVGNMSLARAGMLYLTATLAPEKLEAFWQGLTTDLARVRAADFPPDALQRARYNLEDSMDRTAETLNGLAAWLGMVQFELGGRQGEANLRLAQRNVTATQVQQALDAWLDPRRARVRVLAPEGAPLPDLEAVLQKNWPGKAAPAPARQAAGAAGTHETIDLGAGRTLILIPDATVPYVAMQLMLPGGNALLRQDQQGLANLSARVLVTGCGELDNPALERWLSDRAATLSAGAGLQTFTLTLDGPARFQSDYLALLGDTLRKPRFDAAEVRREADRMKAALRQRADRPASLLFARLNPLLYPGHTYGFDPLGTEAGLAAYTDRDVRSFWERQRVQPWVLSVAGDFDREAVLAFARSLPRPDGQPVRVAPPAWGQDRHAELRAPGRNQAHVLQVFPAVPATHPDAPALMLLQAVLSGQSGLLFSRLRDEQGLGYVVTAMYRALPETGNLAFYIGTTPDRVRQAREGFAAVIADIARTPLPAETLRAGANRLLGDYLRGRQSLNARAGSAATDAVLGRPQEFEKTLIDRAAALTPEALRDVARKYLSGIRPYELVLLP